jgi:ATP-dependent DNA helicase RecQ
MLETLKKYFGYTEFRPLQQEIITAITSRKDVFVLMPTGGGKSLCYQLPSILQNGLTVVVSPLISLMKDQVDSLRDNGIAAAYINSSLSFEEISSVKTQLRANKIKLLYMAPERLMMPQFLEFMKSLAIGLIAIDEAHCISEWGHDFRPEYRQLVILKDEFEKVPIAALTATATPMVQNDITQLLKMGELSLFKASFNRPNLFYRVLHKSDTYQRIVDYLKAHPNESGIIYCQSRKTVDSLADSLTFDGFRALPYHAGMGSKERSKNQDKFIKDDVDIIVATIAFGMGIDKPNVRFVFHYDLPKNLESYYQETGRAGRDGVQSDCILFFSYGDKNKIEYFIEEKENPKEKEIAYNKLHQMIAFCESQMCRRKVILEYLGETYEVDNCGLCDNCVDYKDGREKFDGTVIAQKMLSCVYRLDQRFGMNYVIDVLWGSKSERIFQNGHQHLSTYGVGNKINKKRWQAFARELIQQGYLIIEGGQYPVLRLTEKSHTVLFKEQKVFLTPYVEYKQGKVKEEKLSVNESLFERLRQLRKRIADERNIPPYIIFHDKTLKEMASRIPTSWGDLSTIFGMGEAKLKQYGPRFLKEIVAFVQDRDLRK